MQGSEIWAESWGVLPEVPLFEDKVTGIKYDFNYGFRCHSPSDSDDMFNIHIETSAGDVLCDIPLATGCKWSFPFKYYMDYTVTITGKHGVFRETLDLTDKTVMIMCSVRTLGDSLAWLSAVPAFERKHKCKCVCVVNNDIYELLKDSEQIKVIKLEDKCNYTPYATYYLGLFFDESYSNFWQPYDFRLDGLHEQAKNILGIRNEETRHLELRDTGTNPLAGKKYVCISYSGSRANKFWNNSIGWKKVVKYLHSLQYAVVCIDKSDVCGVAPLYYYMPNGVIDMTGDLSLQSRVDVLKGAEMFIGMASGLSWLAWCSGVPVVMISGFSLPYAEFYTKYRVINTMCECIGCWNDTRIQFSRHDYMWCPRIDDRLKALKVSDPESEAEYQRLSQKRFMCTQTITPNMVIQKINEVLEDQHREN